MSGHLTAMIRLHLPLTLYPEHFVFDLVFFFSRSFYLLLETIQTGHNALRPNCIYRIYAYSMLHSRCNECYWTRFDFSVAKWERDWCGFCGCTKTCLSIFYFSLGFCGIWCVYNGKPKDFSCVIYCMDAGKCDENVVCQREFRGIFECMAIAFAWYIISIQMQRMRFWCSFILSIDCKSACALHFIWDWSVKRLDSLVFSIPSLTKAGRGYGYEPSRYNTLLTFESEHRLFPLIFSTKKRLWTHNLDYIWFISGVYRTSNREKEISYPKYACANQVNIQLNFIAWSNVEQIFRHISHFANEWIRSLESKACFILFDRCFLFRAMYMSLYYWIPIIQIMYILCIDNQIKIVVF